MPPPLSSLCGRLAPRAAEPTASDRNVAEGSYRERSHGRRCSCLMRKRRCE